jgi:hypothetical protein
MASPFQTGKKTVNLAAPAVRVSKIRRDPPPPKLKQLSLEERNDRDRQMAIVGIVAFALALFVIGLGIMSVTGWQPRNIIVNL